MRRAKTLLISVLFTALVAASCGSSPESPWVEAGAEAEAEVGVADDADTDEADTGRSADAEGVAVSTTSIATTTSVATTTTPAPGAAGTEAEKILLAAFAMTSEVESTRLAMTIEMGGMPDMGPDPVALSVDVASSADGSRTQMAMDFSGLLATMPAEDLEAMGPLLLMFAEPFEVRSADGVTYMSAGFFAGFAPFLGIPSIETPWVGFADDGEFDDDFSFEQDQFSAEQLLVVLRGMGDSAEIVGTETIEGVPTTHVSGTFSPASLAASGVDWDVSEFDMTGMMDFGVEIFEIDVWIDESDHVRRLIFGVSDLAAVDPTAPEGAFFRFQIDLGDSNEPVVIEIPADVDVTWLDAMAG